MFTSSDLSAKKSPVTPTENESNGRTSPHTPTAPFTPPQLNTTVVRPAAPVTPTAQRGDGHLGLPLNDVDTSITHRFETVKPIGKGEFSQVFRVTNPSEAQLGEMLPACKQSQVFVVKKSKHPYIGPKDRENKLREAQILDHLRDGKDKLRFVLEICGYWEDNGHLYIQTEYCENGTLLGLLHSAGLEDRLDDFRIWKIFFELAQV